VLGTIVINASVPTTRTTPRLTSQARPRVRNIRGTLPFQLLRYKFRIVAWDGAMVAPLAGSLPLPRWVWGPLLVPCRPGTPAYKHETKVKGRTCYHVLPCVPRLWTPSPYWGGLFWHHHVSSGSGTRLLAGEGFGTTMCPMASNLASQLGRSPVPPCVLWLRIRLPAREGFGTATCPTTPDPISLLGRATLAPPCVPQL
jgi:hypothetical protein